MTRRRPIPGALATAPPTYRMPLVVLALGLASVLLLLASNWIREGLIATDIELIGSVQEIQTRVATSHLWIEEYVTGDQVNLAEIDENFARSRELLEPLADGSVADSTFLTPADHQTITQQASSVAGQLAVFGGMTRSRQRGFQEGRDVGIGSAIDVEYDSAFEQLRSDLGVLQDALRQRLEASERRARMFLSALVFAWLVIVTVAAIALWGRERRRRQAEQALNESQSRLLQAQKMEAVGQLAGGLAHDINNYLAAITTQCELVAMKAGPEDPTTGRMESVMATAARASSLIERLLVVSRRQPARPEPINLNHVVEELERILIRLLGEDVRLETSLETALWPTTLDTSQAEQIVLNLALNAREAMPTGGMLLVETENRSSSGDVVVLRISDTGVGIPDSIRQKIFEPFFSTKEGNHSGLGLATVSGIVEQNGGRIAVTNNSASGTVFEILFPRSSDEALVKGAQKADPGDLSTGPGRILLVEDNAALRRATADLLEAWGGTVTAAANGSLALELFESDTSGFDLIITDVVMPGLSGRELVDQLRQGEPGLEALFVSGYTDDVILRHGIETGNVEFLQKPYSSKDLATKVRQAFARKRGARDAG